MGFCSSCGEILPASAKFCAGCGAPQSQSSSAVSVGFHAPNESSTKIGDQHSNAYLSTAFVGAGNDALKNVEDGWRGAVGGGGGAAPKHKCDGCGKFIVGEEVFAANDGRKFHQACVPVLDKPCHECGMRSVPLFSLFFVALFFSSTLCLCCLSIMDIVF